VLRPIYGVRDIPLGALLQCIPQQQRLNVVEEFFQMTEIKDWEATLVEVGKRYSLEQEQIHSCLHDRNTYEKLIYMQQQNREVFGLNVSPVLLINGKRITGYHTYQQLRDLLENLLEEQKKHGMDI
jgi:predicted DsbA family dithiol-disulfide isomerase